MIERQLFSTDVARMTGLSRQSIDGYVQGLCREFYGIGETTLVYAEGLDLVGADPEAILNRAEAEIDRLFV